MVCAAGSVLAGCAGSSPAQNLPVVTGAMGEQATIAIPGSLAAPTKVESNVLVQGGGAELKNGDAVVVDYTLMNWTGAKLIGSTYSAGSQPNKTQEFVLGATSTLPSWNEVLPHVTVGSRVEIVTPPAGAFGAGGATAYGISGKDDLIYVIDVVGAYAPTTDITGTQPATTNPALPKVSGKPGSGNVSITVPPGVSPPTTVQAKVLIQGSGALVAGGQRLMTQYAGVDWNTGKQFDSSFARKQIASFVYGSGTVISGWNTGLSGARIGDRILLIVPPADAYGSKGVPSAGIGGGDTLVFVIDIVDALS